MRTHHFIPVLLILLSTILLSACDVIGASAATSLGAITPIDTSASTLMVTIGITEDQDATDGRSNITFQFRTAVVPDSYMQLTLGTQPLFVIYTILAFSALAAYGGAILFTHVLPHWVGWFAIVYSLAGLLLAGFTAGNVPPFLHHLMPILIGVLLLLRPSRVPSEQEERQKHAFS